MKYIIGLTVIFMSLGALAQESNPSGGEPEQQVLVVKTPAEPIKLEDQKATKNSSAKKKHKKSKEEKKTEK